mmetsp:Transcript_11782/g.31743  ORF Transcript_11782/g.31743 Transcript_11782/m.31743 type:complete len:125 (+) Transcript_11782:1157-1531(+)
MKRRRRRWGRKKREKKDYNPFSPLSKVKKPETQRKKSGREGWWLLGKKRNKGGWSYISFPQKERKSKKRKRRKKRKKRKKRLMSFPFLGRERKKIHLSVPPTRSGNLHMLHERTTPAYRSNPSR